MHICSELAASPSLACANPNVPDDACDVRSALGSLRCADRSTSGEHWMHTSRYSVALVRSSRKLWHVPEPCSCAECSDSGSTNVLAMDSSRRTNANLSETVTRHHDAAGAAAAAIPPI